MVSKIFGYKSVTRNGFSLNLAFCLVDNSPSLSFKRQHRTYPVREHL